MEKHLQDKHHYEDRYDRITVESCRNREKFFFKQGFEQGEVYEELTHGIAKVGWAIEEILITLDWYNGKESTIKEWMDADKARDEMLVTATTPKKVFCNECFKELHEESRTTYERSANEEVLFFMKCSSGHLPMKGVFTDGEELTIKDKRCPECNGSLKVERLPSDKDEINTKHTCTSCSYTETDSFSLASKGEINDLEYNIDRARFCLSGERLKKAQDEFFSMERMKRLVDGWKQEEEHKEEYEAVDKLQKLTIPQVKVLITKAIEKTKYQNLTFEKPSIEKYVCIEFSLEELETDNPKSSTSDLRKLLKKTLKGTNWRLMNDGINYRLGLMTGRIRAYESKEDLLILVAKH